MIILTKTMKIIDFLSKIANGELEENTKFYDKYEHKTYIYKPKSYNGIYPEGIAYAHENWYLTLKGSSRLLDEVEIIEDRPKEDKKIEKIKAIKDNDENNFLLTYDNKKYIISVVDAIMLDKINEIIDKINGGD